MTNPTPTPAELAAECASPCEVPLVERLRSVPKDWREMREVGSCHHRNVPYGVMCHEAADRISEFVTRLERAEQALAKADALAEELAAARYGFADESDGKIVCNTCDALQGRHHKADCSSEQALTAYRAARAATKETT